MDCRVPQSCSLVMERPGPSSPEILSPEKFSPVSGKVLDGRDGLLGCLQGGEGVEDGEGASQLGVPKVTVPAFPNAGFLPPREKVLQPKCVSAGAAD